MNIEMQMKKISIITFFAVTAVIVISCSDVRRNPGRVYMPRHGLQPRLRNLFCYGKSPGSAGKEKAFIIAIPQVAGTDKKGTAVSFPAGER